MKTVSALSVIISLVAPAAWAEEAWRICEPFEMRFTCIVDGDTLWYRGEKMRLKGVDTPEVDGRCLRERQLAQQASELHLVLIASGIRAINRFGEDRFGRTLVEIETEMGRVGPILLEEGLADVFGDRVRIDWCS